MVMLNNKTILITGATGLIGHYLIGVLDNVSKIGIKPKMLYVIHQSEVPFYFKLSDFPLNIVLLVSYALGYLIQCEFEKLNLLISQRS